MSGTTATRNDELESAARRRLLQTLAAGTAAMAMGILGPTTWNSKFTILTFGDSILDCARYNEYGVHPGQLIVRNDDRLFPDFKGRDLSSSAPAQLDHRARDGGRVDDLSRQARGIKVAEPAVALVTVGGNDLLTGLAADQGDGIARFQQQLDAFLHALPVRPVLLGTVYDPTSVMIPATFWTLMRTLPGPA